MFEIEGQNTVFHHNSPKLDPDEGPTQVNEVQVESTMKYTGNGFVPCKGYAPTPNWCRCILLYIKIEDLKQRKF